METNKTRRLLDVSRGRSFDGLKRPVSPRFINKRQNLYDVYNLNNVRLGPKHIGRKIVKHEIDRQDKVSPIDLNLPGGDSDKSYKLIVKKPILPTIRKWTLRLALSCICLVLIGGGLLFADGYRNIHKILRGGSKSTAILQKNVNPSVLKTEGDGRINILLLGRGGGNHDGPDLTDSMMIASINPVNKSITLLSIPRDLWVDVPNQGAMKINAAWETGEFNYEGKIAPGSTNPNAIEAGFNEADQMVESVLGLTIDYNMIADFQAFSQAVDTLNGVTINVPTELFDPTMAWENSNNPILAAPGLQTFDGNQALNYVRSRETTSDFARAQRQRAVLVAIAEKAKTLGVISNPLKIAGLFSDFGNNIATDLSLKGADQLYNIVKGVSGSNVTSIGLTDTPTNYVTTGDINGQSIVEPTAGVFNYSQIQAYVRSQLQDPYILKEHAPILILNGTTVQGLATTTQTTLAQYGYNVIAAGNAPTNDYSQTVIIDLAKNGDPYTKHYLEQRFNTTAITSLSDNTLQTNGAAFVIILGSNETINSQG